MELLKKTQIQIVLFFLFIFPLSNEIYPQERILDPFFHPDSEQKFNPLIYRDTVIINLPGLPVIIDVYRLVPPRKYTPECQLTKPLLPPLPVSKHKLFADAYNKNRINHQAYKYIVEKNIRQIKYTTADFTGKVEPLAPIQPNIFQFLFKVEDDIDRNNVSKPERIFPKRRYWLYNGNHKIQLAQNYISGNWYKGGVKHFNLLNLHSLNFNYKKNKIQTNHLVEWKLNLFTNPNDTIRNYRIGDDLIRTYSDFGVQAINNWYYSTNIEFKTQMFKNFKENAINPLSAAFAPFYINIGVLGMKFSKVKDFPKVKDKKITFSADISPLSVEYITVLNNNIDAKRFGIAEGKKHLINYGSKINSKLSVSFNKNVKFNSRFDYFTNYEKITAEWENKFDMPINRYFSTSLFLFVRFDDNSKLKTDKKLGYFQVNELFAFGFNYIW